MLWCMDFSSALMLRPAEHDDSTGGSRECLFGGFTFGFDALGVDHGGFARHFEHSTAPSGDRDLGSGHRSISTLAWDSAQTQLLGSVSQTLSLSGFSTMGGCATSNGHRIGEAANPGPPLTISFGNPTGLRNKEAILFQLPPGIHNLAETHLASDGMRTACGLLRNWASTSGGCSSFLVPLYHFEHAVPPRGFGLASGSQPMCQSLGSTFNGPRTNFALGELKQPVSRLPLCTSLVL